MPLKLVIHDKGQGECILAGKSSAGYYVTFEDGSGDHGFFSHKSLVQVINMKLSVKAKGDAGRTPPATTPVATEATT